MVFRIARQIAFTCMQDSPNRRGIMGSKACGEPSLLLAVSVLHAFRMAANAARSDLARCNAVLSPVLAAAPASEGNAAQVC